MSHDFHSLKVAKVVKETDLASSIYFDIPTDLQEAYIYKPGQYLTLKFVINGDEVRRAYSICTSPLDKELAVNVKRVNKGLVSNYVNDNVKAGDTVEVMQPDGNFYMDFSHEHARDLYFFASGSGITPIMSMIKTALEEEPRSRCYLLYGNKNENSVIFKDQLDAMAARYKGQFFLRETLSQPLREKKGGLSGLFSKGKINWTGWQGRITGKKMDEFLTEHPAQHKDSHYFVCGPGAMIDTLIDHLENKQIEKDRLHTEHFVSSAAPKVPATGSGGDSQVKVHMNGKSWDIVVPPQKTILDVMIDEKIDAPYSCTSGACSTCIAKVKSGDVTMDVCYALDDSEVANGYILACQARAMSPEVEVTFDT